MHKTKQWLQERIGKDIQIIMSGESDVITVLDEEHAQLLFDQQDEYEYKELLSPAVMNVIANIENAVAKQAQEESFADEWLDNQANKW